LFEKRRSYQQKSAKTKNLRTRGKRRIFLEKGKGTLVLAKGDYKDGYPKKRDFEERTPKDHRTSSRGGKKGVDHYRRKGNRFRLFGCKEGGTNQKKPRGATAVIRTKKKKGQTRFLVSQCERGKEVPAKDVRAKKVKARKGYRLICLKGGESRRLQTKKKGGRVREKEGQGVLFLNEEGPAIRRGR